MPNGINLTCEVQDASQSGAAIVSEERPALGLLLTIGKVQGRVVRHLENGFAVEFTRLQHPDFLQENLSADKRPCEKSNDPERCIRRSLACGTA